MKLIKSDKYFLVFIFLLLCIGAWWWIYESYEHYEAQVYYNEHKNEIDYAVERYENMAREYYNII